MLVQFCVILHSLYGEIYILNGMSALICMFVICHLVNSTLQTSFEKSWVVSSMAATQTYHDD